MLLSCPVAGSFLWVGKDATVPFFSKISTEVISVPAYSLSDAELRKWARLVQKPKDAENTVPYMAENKLKNESLFIER